MEAIPYLVPSPAQVAAVDQEVQRLETAALVVAVASDMQRAALAIPLWLAHRKVMMAEMGLQARRIPEAVAAVRQQQVEMAPHRLTKRGTAATALLLFYQAHRLITLAVAVVVEMISVAALRGQAV